MPKITSYQEGTPCWISLATSDIDTAKSFYAELFGWSYDDTGEAGGGYQMATLAGEQVAGIDPKPPGEPGPDAWLTFLWADNVDSVVRKLQESGGTLAMEPMDVMDQGRMAIAIDPVSAVFGLWQGGAHRGAGLANEPGTFVWNDCLATDPDRARTFYQQIFGYEYESVEAGLPDYTTFKVAGRPVGGIGAQPPEVPQGVPSFWNTYFSVEDIDQSVAKIRELGGEIIAGPHTKPFGRFAVARDQGGASFCVHTAPSG
ncbi:MAG: VOC family protein [Streptomycetaceae bacterium]|nr:VOC family protein [Streptomycetaceae bacterium]